MWPDKQPSDFQTAVPGVEWTTGAILSASAVAFLWVYFAVGSLMAAADGAVFRAATDAGFVLVMTRFLFGSYGLKLVDPVKDVALNKLSLCVHMLGLLLGVSGVIARYVAK